MKKISSYNGSIKVSDDTEELFMDKKYIMQPAKNEKIICSVIWFVFCKNHIIDRFRVPP